MRRTIELRLHARQYDFVFSPARYTFYVGGRGVGKTFAGALRAIFATQQQPDSLGLVGAPTHPTLRDAAQRMFFELCPPSLGTGNAADLPRDGAGVDAHAWHDHDGGGG